MDDITLTYYGHVFDASGYGRAARAYIHALHAAGVSLAVVDLMNHGRQVSDELVESLLGRRLDADFQLFHGIPPQWARLAFPRGNAIGMTVWETDTMPAQWRTALSHVIDVWVPCEFNAEVFRRHLRTSVFRLPHVALPPFHLNGTVIDADRLIGSTPSDFVFYSIFEWQDRKGPHDMLRAYFQAFPDDGRTVLVLKVNGNARDVAARAIDETRRETASSARVSLLACGWGEAEIEALQRRGNCYVSLHRGEGWGYPLFDAAARGKPVIATAFSGPLDYLSPSGANLVPCTLAPVRQPYVYYAPNMKWAVPDLREAARLMRVVYEHPADAGARATELSAAIRDTYSPKRVGAAAKERLLELLDRRAAARRPATPVERGQPLAPSVPVPATWYDEDYFERGVKSNWTGGYRWESFSGLFRETASYLVDLFPQAASFLDAGCAKGFLVRSLREAGKQCWGLDCSQWAIEHAEAAARPYLVLSNVEDAAFDREVDVTVAFDLLSHLTEDQAAKFLVRARAWTRVALLAAIPSFDDAAEEARHRARTGNRDLSHVTMKSRAWWHALFLRAGWRQDALQRLGAERCQAHPLPGRMNWKMYAYSPR